VANVNALGNCTSYTYDIAGQHTAVQNALGYFTTSSYDKAGLVSTVMNASGFITSYNYANTGHLRSEPLGASVTTYSYNVSLWMTGVNASGSLSSSTYRADGKRISGIESGGTLTTYIWDGEDYLGEY